MHIVQIFAKATDDRKYNLDMSVISRELTPLANQYGAITTGVGPSIDPNKPSYMAIFNDVAAAKSFAADAGKKKLPAMKVFVS